MHKIVIKDIEKILSYQFNNKSILNIALTHPSVKSSPNNYERFEFLGDSIIDFVISECLVNNFRYDEGKSTIIKSEYVSRNNLAKISEGLNLIKFAKLHKSINFKSKSTINRINADLYESIVGGIYLDSNMETVKKFIYNTIINSKNMLEESNYKGKLNEFCHLKGYDDPVYTLVKKTGLNHNIKFSVNLLVNGKKYMGSGHKIKTAEINSAKKALIDLLGF